MVPFWNDLNIIFLLAEVQWKKLPLSPSYSLLGSEFPSSPSLVRRAGAPVAPAAFGMP
jgi:hypothetical protein